VWNKEKEMYNSVARLFIYAFWNHQHNRLKQIDFGQGQSAENLNSIITIRYKTILQLIPFLPLVW